MFYIEIVLNFTRLSICGLRVVLDLRLNKNNEFSYSFLFLLLISSG